MSKNKARKISDEFVLNLKTGVLAPFLLLAKKDATLFVGIRNNYINVYYRGGNLVKITEKTSSGNVPTYIGEFDKEYVKNADILKRLTGINGKLLTPEAVKEWINILPSLKNEMDVHPKLGQEREFQQLIARDCNGLSIRGDKSSPSDYFICDIEYAEEFGGTNARFDMLGVLWESNSQKRQNKAEKKLAIIEVKYEEAALLKKTGGDAKKSDIPEHITDLNKFLSKPEYVENLKKDAISAFNQLVDLGLLRNHHHLEGFSKEIEYILILINHDPESEILLSALMQAGLPVGAELKFATSTFMGYRLFKENIYPVTEFLAKYKDSIYSKRKYDYGALLAKYTR